MASIRKVGQYVISGRMSGFRRRVEGHAAGANLDDGQFAEGAATPEEAIRRAREIAAALRPGGSVFVFEVLAEDDIAAMIAGLDSDRLVAACSRSNGLVGRHHPGGPDEEWFDAATITWWSHEGGPDLRPEGVLRREDCDPITGLPAGADA